MIRFSCPRCQSVLKAHNHKAGSKVACPKCQQRLQIPTLPRNKTILAPLVTQPPRHQGRRDIAADGSDVEPHRGIMILVFGILSLFTIPFIFGPMAWIMGSRDLRKMRAGQMDLEGRAMTQAGRICGMIVTLMCLTTLLLVFSCCGLQTVLLSPILGRPEPVQTQPLPPPGLPGLPQPGAKMGNRD